MILVVAGVATGAFGRIPGGPLDSWICLPARGQRRKKEATLTSNHLFYSTNTSFTFCRYYSTASGWQLDEVDGPKLSKMVVTAQSESTTLMNRVFKRRKCFVLKDVSRGGKESKV